MTQTERRINGYAFVESGLVVIYREYMSNTSRNIEGARQIVRDAEVVAFDWDGTLIGTVGPKLLQNQTIAREFGRDLTIDQVRDIWNRSTGFHDLMEQLTGSDDMDAIMAVVNRDYDNPAYAKQPFDFTPRVLRTARELGKRVALITNVSRELLEKDALKAGVSPLTSWFDFVQTTDAVMYDDVVENYGKDELPKKPDPAVFDRMLKYMSARSKQVAYFGDEQKDINAAQACDMAFIGVETGMLGNDDFEKSAVLSVASLNDLF